MRHPFDGIIVPAEPQKQSPTSRRKALALIVGAGAASLVAGAAQGEGPTDIAIDKEGVLATPPAEAPLEQKFHLYYVVPKEVRLFDARRRMDLYVRGDLQPGLPLHKELGDKQGFLAWLNDDEAAKVKAAEDVATFHAIVPDDIVVQGKPPAKGVATLRVFAAPIGWRTPPGADTYLNLKQLGDLWTAKFAMNDGVTVIAGDKVRQPFIQFAEGKVNDEVLNSLKAHPQIYGLQWLTPMIDSTRAIGEEGGVVTTDALREEGATTLALGEEGGVPSTRALGEEGGGSTEAVGEEGGEVTTFAVGEEGASTRARGEEGGGSTRALGEEGGGVSTRALGEEGGGISTKALGEEGGVRPMPAPLPMPEATTLAEGEEGGGVVIPRLK